MAAVAGVYSSLAANRAVLLADTANRFVATGLTYIGSAWGTTAATLEGLDVACYHCLPSRWRRGRPCPVGPGQGCVASEET